MNEGIYAQPTPWHLWVIAVIALLWNAMGAFDYLMTQTQNDAYMANFTQTQLDYFYGLPTWVVASWALSVWSGVLGSLLLLLRKKICVAVFWVSLIAFIITAIHNYLLSDGMQVMGSTIALVMTALIFSVAVLLIFYSRAMTKRGVLT